METYIDKWKKFLRETDTLDTFVTHLGTSKILLSKNENHGFDIEDIKYWMPVDQYIGN